MHVSVRELKARLSEYLRRVQEGEEVVITRRGAPVGRIVAFRETEGSSEADVVQALRRLPWVRPSAGGKPLGAANPPRIAPGEKTLAEIVIEDRG
jgi:prevent-host-death family protein